MAGSLHLWLLAAPTPGNGPGGTELSVLSEAERERADAFRRPADRDLYVTSHLALRRVLGAFLGIGAGQVHLAREPCPTCGAPHGRPAVLGAPGPLHFSLSHSHGLALIAVADRVVGADVQGLPRREAVGFCGPSLHPAEYQELLRVPAEQQSAAFARLWARKEAYLKGLGTGLSRRPGADYLGDAAAERPPGWAFVHVPCGPGHAAVTAVRDAHVRDLTVHLRTTVSNSTVSNS